MPGKPTTGAFSVMRQLQEKQREREEALPYISTSREGILKEFQNQQLDGH